ncbi:hypothetical protein LCGC14_1001260 [marine sediment metagenome]|uniref:Uncharacterized protein n=1 Tax=marine sediment metagenome TaxID=412755 RepID=A0A0F9N306_9ZZZZ
MGGGEQSRFGALLQEGNDGRQEKTGIGCRGIVSYNRTIIYDRYVCVRAEMALVRDGKTIFNYRTGELRYTASGRSVKEVRAAALKRYKLEDEQRSRERITREQRERSILEHKKLVHAHNSKIFHSLKYFSGNYPELGSYWSQITRPFRVNQLLTRREHANLLDFLGRAVANGPHKNDLGIMSAINQLNSWDLTYSK